MTGAVEVRPAGRSDTSVLARGAGIALVGRFAGRGVQVACEVILARMLGPLGFGLYAAGFTVLRISGLIAPLGLDRGVVRYGTPCAADDPAGLKGVVAESLGAAFAVGAAWALLLGFGADRIAAGFFGKPELASVLRGLAPAVALFAGLRVAAAATRISRNTTWSVLAEDLARPLSNLALILAAWWLGWGVGGAVLACSASFAVGFVIALFGLVRLYPMLLDGTIGFRTVGSPLFRFSLTASVSAVAILLIGWIDRLMLSAMRPVTEVGVYQAATQPAFLFSTILVSFNAILVPMIADLWPRGERARLLEIYRISTKWGLYLAAPLFLFVVFQANGLIRVVFGARYVEGALPMMVLAAGQMVNAGTGAVGPLLIMTGHAKRWMIFTSTGLAVAVGLNVLLIPRAGILGAAVATAISIAGLFLAGVWQVRRVHGFWPYDMRAGKGLVAAAAAAVALTLIRLGLGGESVAGLVVSAITAPAIFGGILLLLGLDDEDRELMRLLARRLGRRGARE